MGRSGAAAVEVRLLPGLLLLAALAPLARAAAVQGEAKHAQDAGEHGDSVHNIGAGSAAQDMNLDQWCHAKNSDVGPAVSRRLTELGTWQRDVDMQPTSIDPIPGLSPGVPGFVAHGLLAAEESRELIAGFPTEGAGHMSGERVSELYRDRNVKARVLSKDDELARRLFERLKQHLPVELDGGRLLGVNPNFRFIHYETGGHHSTHIDGREPGEPVYSAEAGGWVQSRLTLQVYLNGDYDGGEFAIVSPVGNASDGTNVKHVIKPKLGDAVVFYQERLTPPSAYPPYELQHEAADVIKGQKYACRTMVDYVFPDKERAKLGNVRDDTIRREIAASLSAPCQERGRHRVLAVGNTIIDMILTMPYIPQDDKIRVTSKKKYVGGQGANAAIAMALLGSEVSFVSRLGDDGDGEFARRRYVELGMDPKALIVVPGSTTSSAAVAVSTGDDHHRVSMIYDDELLHGERRLSDAVVAEYVKRLEAGDFAAVYSDGWQTDLALPIARAAAKHKMQVIVDVEELTEDTRELSDLSTAMIANTPMIIQMAGCEGQAGCDGVEGAVRHLALQHGGRTVVATGGPEGSFGMDGRSMDTVLHVPCIRADVRDTTGAGDTFHAGFVDAVMRGFGLRDAMVFATHAAAAKVETPGPAVSSESLQRGGVVSSVCS